MTWITPTTKATGSRIGYTDWTDEIIGNVNELYHRRADSLSGILIDPSSTPSTKNAPLRRTITAPEMGGIGDWTSLDTIAGSANSGVGGGPGSVFTVPKGMTGLWRFTVTGGTQMTKAGCVQVMWSFNSTQTSTGFPAATTNETAWTYQWTVASGCIWGDSNDMEPQGVVLDRFTSGDEIRFYTVARYPSGSTVAASMSALGGFKARLWAQFLGTTI